MKIIRPYAKIIRAPVDAMLQIEWAARVSHRAEDKQTDDSWKRFIQSVVIDHGDWSVVEHVSVTVDAVVDRGITHEWVRHRLFSFTQESTRFVNYEKKMTPSFIYPKPEVECERCLNGDQPTYNLMRLGPQYEHRDGAMCVYRREWLLMIDQLEYVYKQLLSDWRPQEARSILPNALASRIVITGNLRNWRHLFIMRTTAETHPQFRQVTVPLLAEFQSCFPLLFDDIIPLSKQSSNLKLPR